MRRWLGLAVAAVMVLGGAGVLAVAVPRIANHVTPAPAPRYRVDVDNWRPEVRTRTV